MPETIDGRKVSNAEAFEKWTPIAHNLLVETARTYNSFITYGELADRMQQGSGISTRQRLDYWIGDVLGAVSDKAERLGEPHLTSLCVQANQSIGRGYPWTPADADEVEREEIAARDRLECYRRYATDLPPDGGTPALTPVILERLNRQRRAEPAPRSVCQICGIELPATGICDNH